MKSPHGDYKVNNNIETYEHIILNYVVYVPCARLAQKMS